jgi:hypothetical protein
MKSYQIESLFDSETFNELKGFAMSFINSGNMLYDSLNYNRYYKSIHLPEELRNKILSEIKNKLSNDKLDIVYIQLIKYQIVDGNVPALPLHKDKYPSQFFIDLNIETTIPRWGVLVEGSYFVDKENDAVVLYGNDDLHFRPTYPSTSENDYSIMMLINLAEEGHWSLERKKSLSPEVLEYLENRPVKILKYQRVNRDI